MRVLVVEDEAPLRQYLRQRLSEKGYVVETAENGREALHLVKERLCDIAVIDLGLPGISGIDLIKHLRRAQFTFSIIILTARGQWKDKVEGFNAGADDYLVKPFHFEELLARFNALIRRAGGFSAPFLQCGPIVLHSVTGEVKVNNEPIELTAFEYKVLEYLMLHPGKIVSKMELTEHLYQQDFDRDSNVIEVFLGRLRKKLDPDETLHPIETLRGRGYRFTLSPNRVK